MKKPDEKTSAKTNKSNDSETVILVKSGIFKLWFKKFGFIGFLFFFIKGLLWLIIPYLIAVGFFNW